MHDVTADDKKILWDSFTALIPISDQVAAAFYEQLFSEAPGLRSLFPSDMNLQKEKFMMTLAAALEILDQPDRFRTELQALGARHVTYGAERGHYDVVGRILIQTLTERTPMSPVELDAWTRLYGEMVEVMVA